MKISGRDANSYAPKKVRKRPPPENLAVDSSGFSHSTGGEWFSVRLKKSRRRRFHALHNAVDTDTLMIHATLVRGKPGIGL
jgi:hypothetical protein